MSRRPHLRPGGADGGYGQFYQGPPNFNFAIQSQALPFAPNPTVPFFQNPGFLPQQFPGFQARPNPNELVEKVERTVVKARRDLVAAKQSATSWKVAEAVLLALQVDSWTSLGLKMQQVPSLNHHMSIEGKINAFIHCFVAVSRITTLYDLDMAICQNEGIDEFEDLELGPLVRHPLVVHYFSVSHGTNEVYKITAEEVILSLAELMDVHSRKDIINTEELLHFIAKKCSVVGRESLGVRVQSLGWHISCIRKAKRTEIDNMKKFTSTLKPSPNERLKHNIGYSDMKEQLDDRFSAISRRFEPFSSVCKQFSGKHIKFVSSSSGEEDSDDSMHEENKNDKDAHSHFQTPQSIISVDKTSSCPYPSATEEIKRLGLKGDATCSPNCSDNGELSQSKLPHETSQNSQQAKGDDKPAATSGISKFSESKGSVRKKRRSEKVSGILTAPQKKAKRDKVGDMMLKCHDQTKEVNSNEIGLPLVTDSTRMFITTWKEACREHTEAEVFERMLEFYKTKARQRKRMKSMLSSHPFAGLLNVTVASIKCGLWDNIYDSLHAISQDELNNSHYEKSPKFEITDVKGTEKDASAVVIDIVERECSVEDVIEKVASYFELDHEIYSDIRSPIGNRLAGFRELCNCEFWVAEKFGVKEFKSLGHGDFLMFLEQHASLLPNVFWKFLNGDEYAKCPLKICLLDQQVVELVSQASNTLSGNETVTEQMISTLLSRQFPLFSFKIQQNGSLEEFQDVIEKQKNNVISSSLVFSAPLLGSCFNKDSLGYDESVISEVTDIRTDIGSKAIASKSVISKDAIEVLRKAPMLSDLKSWSHWDTIFAPSLGSLVEWLGKEVSKEDLWCLLTEDGKVIRINPAATVHSFLEAAVKGSSFETAVELLSIYCTDGGERHVRFSLLKDRAQQAFEVILKNCLESVEANNCQDILTHANKQQIYKEAMPVASKFFLDCLSYFPSYHRRFAADVLLSGLRYVVKDAHSAILCKCNQLDQRIMLHDVGMALGIVEWINDYHDFSKARNVDSSVFSEASCLKASRPDLDSRNMQDVTDRFPSSEDKMIVSVEADSSNNAEGSTEISYSGCTPLLSAHEENIDGTLVIESIRREEFGLDSSLPDMESSMLSKQHARLGRALHCLSQELYSQDSHFLLELVQNADDNMYPKNVEPTLSFILLEEGIVILNNERGFSAENIRALCDVGNSTKKGSGAGYIGQKGIGFKSVFRVTDAPEIHSNGFHVKFDISEGEIGFVLPTLVPPCNIDMYSRLACAGDHATVNDCWNTCIVLPFRSKLSKGNAVNSVLTMFSDLDSSLLLFLHRLQCIKFRDMVNDSRIVMRKEIVGNGIIRISGGKKKMNCFVVSQKVKMNSIHRGVKTTEIAIAFTLQELDNGGYSPHLDQQPVFAFLPLRKYGLKFILQGDFVLPSSREEVDGNSLWNQHLLSEFPHLFVSAQTSFCALPCYKENPAKAITAYMSFVPLCGEVQGFFTNLPRFIISELRASDCLLLEGGNNRWVRPPKVLRGWNEQARSLLPENLLFEHLGLVGFLQKDIILSDTLAVALGIKEYGPKILVDFMYSVSSKEDDIKAIGLGWISSWLNELHTLSIQSDQISRLKGIPFIPLSDGTYSSVSEGRIWIRSYGIDTSFDGEDGPEVFPNIYAELRTVNPALFTTSPVIAQSSESMVSADNLIGLLRRVGVQQLSSHDITVVHILPALTNGRVTCEDKKLMIEYLCFVMVHLHSACPACRVEREFILTELRNKVSILTNHGFKRPVDVPIHFSKEFGNPVDMHKLINVEGIEWHEVDISYVKHPSTQSLSSALLSWRKFLQEIGVSDFVKIVQVDNVVDIAHAPGSLAKDWESQELVKLLSLLSSNGNQESCKYLLEAVDILWDDHFRDKVAGCCSSVAGGGSEILKPSCISCFCDFKWVVSSIDSELHFPRDLFYDCDAVRSIIGASAPYAVPKVRNEKLVNDFGFKTRVSLDDLIEIFKVWRSLNSFEASVSQMRTLYTFISNEIAVSERNVVQELCSEPFIFVPSVSGCGSEDVVTGVLYSPKEVYWHDSSGSVDLLKGSDVQDGSVLMAHRPLNNTLRHVYPRLHHFFVNECGVCEIPPFNSYLEILQQLSAAALPSQAAKSVFQIFLKWAEGLQSGQLGLEDIISFKECLRKLNFTVLPTRLDKWVSLHPSFGLVCWCDDEKLKKEFKDSDNIDFLYFGELTDDEKEMLQTKMSVLMQKLEIPVLSLAVTREAIYYGPSNSNLKASMVNWALPYAQRYMLSLHPEKYTQLKQSGFDKVNMLRVLAVDKLYYRNVIKSYGCVSKKRHECDCLLEDAVLYSIEEADSHSIYMELSRLLFGGIPELHMANFLDAITNKNKLGLSEEQVELFVVNSQKVPQLPDEESVWSLSLAGDDLTVEEGSAATVTNQQLLSSAFKRKAGPQDYRPADWKTAPDFRFARENGYKTLPAIQPSSSGQTRGDDDGDDKNWTEDFSAPASASVWLPESEGMEDKNWTEDFSAPASASVWLPEWEGMEDMPEHASTVDITCDPIVNAADVVSGVKKNSFSMRDRLCDNTPNMKQAMLTGRQGEKIAFKYFSEKVGEDVKWVNQDNESGLPYDIVIEGDGKKKEYIEVKATTSARKDWFNITRREWQFAVENGESFSIAHVLLSGKNGSKISVFKNPAKLCQQGKLQLVVMMPRR